MAGTRLIIKHEEKIHSLSSIVDGCHFLEGVFISQRGYDKRHCSPKPVNAFHEASLQMLEVKYSLETKRETLQLNQIQLNS